MKSALQSPPNGLHALRRLVRKQKETEKCELCATPVSSEHTHLLDRTNGRVLCACTACAVLFIDSATQRYQCVPRGVLRLDQLRIGDLQWNALGIPIGLVFFSRSSITGTVGAVYPSPAGPTRSEVDEEIWQEFASLEASLHSMKPDVEALLVNRVRGASEHYLVPIDDCYKLTGLIRIHWTGFSGGDAVWQHIEGFFDDLKRRSAGEGRVRRA
jgi:hypothetical protein